MIRRGPKGLGGRRADSTHVAELGWGGRAVFRCGVERWYGGARAGTGSTRGGAVGDVVSECPAAEGGGWMGG